MLIVSGAEGGVANPPMFRCCCCFGYDRPEHAGRQAMARARKIPNAFWQTGGFVYSSAMNACISMR